MSKVTQGVRQSRDQSPDRLPPPSAPAGSSGRLDPIMLLHLPLTLPDLPLCPLTHLLLCPLPHLPLCPLPHLPLCPLPLTGCQTQQVEGDRLRSKSDTQTVDGCVTSHGLHNLSVPQFK